MTTSRNGVVIDADRRTASRDGKWVRWTRRMKTEFLDHLAATCNVTASAAVIGVSPSSVYALRRRDRAFAEAWNEALTLGYVMLETLLVGHALAGGGADAGGRIEIGAPEIGPIDRDLALKLLGDHRGKLSGAHARGGPKPRVATREETNAAILKKLDLMAKARARAAAKGGAADDMPASEGASDEAAS